jgi:hypothetical protein
MSAAVLLEKDDDKGAEAKGVASLDVDSSSDDLTTRGGGGGCVPVGVPPEDRLFLIIGSD